MKGIIPQPGVPFKKKGDGLKHEEVNSIVSSISNSVNAINKKLLSECNVNLEELQDPSIEITLQEAIIGVTKNRRSRGMRIRFLCSITHSWETYDYTGSDVSQELWENPENWILSDQVDEIDGGEDF